MIQLPFAPLYTERLMLRPPAERDAAAMVDFAMSPRFRHIDTPKARDAAWMHFSAIVGHWVLRGFGLWAVTLKGEDRILGLVGPWYPETWPEHEIGWSVETEAEGRGIAFEAAVAARAHAYRVLGWKTAVSYVAPANARSIRLAERMGAVLEPNAPDDEDDSLTYRHPAPVELGL